MQYCTHKSKSLSQCSLLQDGLHVEPRKTEKKESSWFDFGGSGAAWVGFPTVPVVDGDQLWRARSSSRGEKYVFESVSTFCIYPVKLQPVPTHSRVNTLSLQEPKGHTQHPSSLHGRRFVQSGGLCWLRSQVLQSLHQRRTANNAIWWGQAVAQH